MKKYTVYLLVASPMGYYEFEVASTSKRAALIKAAKQLTSKNEIKILGFSVV